MVLATAVLKLCMKKLNLGKADLYPRNEKCPVLLLVSDECCFAAYCARSIDELSGRTTGRLRYIRPDTAHAIQGTA